MTKAASCIVDFNSPSSKIGGARPYRLRSLLFLGMSCLLALVIMGGCSIVSTRPVQDMSDTAAAIRAAREVQADTLAPELYRQANEWFFKAKREYKFKNFSLATSYSDKARLFAEDAEFEAIRNGGNRNGDTPNTSDPLAPGLNGPTDKAAAPVATAPYSYPTPAGVPMEAAGGTGAPGGAPPGGAPGPAPTP